jgi:transcriptional regulator with XRE-family HTH domain
MKPSVPGTALLVNQLVGKRIRRAMAMAGVTEQELATKIAISEEQLNDFCLGNQRVSPPVLIEISRALNQGTAWFFQPNNDLD